jgi:hypothetical protein
LQANGAARRLLLSHSDEVEIAPKRLRRELPVGSDFALVIILAALRDFRSNWNESFQMEAARVLCGSFKK